jgi:hypothetical protein
VTGFGRFNGIDGQRPHGIDAKVVYGSLACGIYLRHGIFLLRLINPHSFNMTTFFRIHKKDSKLAECYFSGWINLSIKSKFKNYIIAAAFQVNEFLHQIVS